MASTKRVLIIGAGIVGLATALRLRRSNWDVVIAERAPGLRGDGYLIDFSGLGYDAAERMGLIRALRAVQPSPFELTYVDERGRVRARMRQETQQRLIGDRTISLFRGDLEAVLHDALDDNVEFRFATTAESIIQDPAGVSVTCTDGRSERFDLVVGADGLHSRVRSLIFGPERDFRYDFGDVIAISLLETPPQAVGPGTGISMALVGREVSVVHPSNSPAVAFFIFSTQTPDADLAAGPMPALRRRYGDLDWLVPELLDSLEDTGSAYFDQVSQIQMDRWSSGRVVLVGDAAWCVSLFAGYGSALAVGGAELLGDLLDADPDDIPSALHRWEQQLRPAAEYRRRSGRRLKSLFVPQNSLAKNARIQSIRMANSPLGGALMRRFTGLSQEHLKN